MSMGDDGWTADLYNVLVSPLRSILCAVFLVGCPDAEEADATKKAAALGAAKAAPAAAGDADVTNVFAREEADGSWTFHVSVEHPDKGLSDYANGWDILTEDGTVLKDRERQAFTKILRHAHVDEQPFTRTVKGVQIPEGVEQLTVRAHDKLGGFGGKVVTVKLNRRFGENFSVKRAL